MGQHIMLWLIAAIFTGKNRLSYAIESKKRGHGIRAMSFSNSGGAMSDRTLTCLPIWNNSGKRN